MASFTQIKTRSGQKLEQQQAAALAALLDPKHPVPEVMTGTLDIRKLRPEQRKGLCFGPNMHIYIGTQYAGYAAKRALMATSKPANDFIRKNPLAKEIHFDEKAADVNAMKIVLRYFTVHNLGGETVRNFPIGKSFIEAAKLYRAATVLGLSAHIGHIVPFLHRGIDRKLLTYQELDTLMASVTPDDKLFKHVAHCLSHLRFLKAIPDPENFAEYLETQPALAKAMSDIDAGNAAKRKLRLQEKREEKRREARATSIALRKEEKVAYNARVKELKEKLAKSCGGILVLTADEVELKRKAGL